MRVLFAKEKGGAYAPGYRHASYLCSVEGLERLQRFLEHAREEARAAGPGPLRAVRMSEWDPGWEPGDPEVAVMVRPPRRGEPAVPDAARAAPEADRSDPAHLPGLSPHIHFKDGSAMDRSGVEHGSVAAPPGPEGAPGPGRGPALFGYPREPGRGFAPSEPERMAKVSWEASPDELDEVIAFLEGAAERGARLADEGAAEGSLAVSEIYDERPSWGRARPNVIAAVRLGPRGT